MELIIFMENRSTVFSIIGGDLRSVALSNLIAEDKYKINVFGFNNRDFSMKFLDKDNLNSAISGSRIIIGPTPCSSDNETLNSPYYENKIFLQDIFKLMTKNQIFIAGKITDQISGIAKFYNIKIFDILKREEMSVLNSIPTAEGAIQIAMEKMQITLHNCNALVLGYGRIGKILSKMLFGIGSNVYVLSRKYSDMAWIRGYGYHPLTILELPNSISKMNVIFNTIPFLFLKEDFLNSFLPRKEIKVKQYLKWL